VKINIGWREWIYFPDYDNFKLKAKIDSGARTSALHATHIREFEKEGEKWVRFRVYQSRQFIDVERPVIRKAIIKNSFGESQKRPLVLLKIKLGDKSWETDISLTQRSGMKYPMLIGRNTLKKKHLIHPKRSFVLNNKLNSEHINSF
tara:strand:+ start:471 stop:911 length:441 start_codon:yes stop_codon:yes gene_type:complete